MVALLSAHAVAGVAALVLARRLGRTAIAIAAAAPVATIVWLATAMTDVLDGSVRTSHLGWVPSLGLTIDLRLDGFAALMLALVASIGTLVLAYAHGYFGSADGVRAGRVAGLLVLFAGAMAGIVLADNVLLLFVCWELTSVTSYLLIAIDDRSADARAAAQHALLVTGAGGLAMLGGFVLLAREAGTYRLSELLAQPPSGSTVGVALVLVVIGAATKSAQYPFHSWLPGAMVAPTPISAYLHSAAMVKAGVYVIARFAPAFAEVPVWRPLVVSVGLVTMVAGGLRALRPTDLKRLLAFGTISQLGFLVVLFGWGAPETTVAGCAVLVAHALFKAALFMTVGIVDHQTHRRDLRTIPALGPGWTPTKVAATVAAASMAAVFPMAGFVAKEEAYAALVDGGRAERWLLVGIVAGSVLTVAYSLRIVVGLWRPDAVAPSMPGDREVPSPAPTSTFLAPAAVLAAATAAIGVVTGPWSRWTDAAARSLDHHAHAHLALWHGPSAALALSLLTLGLGSAVFAARGRIEAVARRAPGRDGTDRYGATVEAVLRAARWTTARTQPTRLPHAATLVLLVAATAPLAAFALGGWSLRWPGVVGTWSEVAGAALIVVGAVAATITQRRFAAALLLGVAGYGMALLFLLQGAPDLALTQFGVETLSVVLFLLVLRRLPDRFDRRSTVPRPARVAAAAAVGVAVVVLALAGAGARTEAPVSDAMVAQAKPEGDGSNVVNVILVDIRGMDTMGEVTVLAVAALGILALVGAGRRREGKA